MSDALFSNAFEDLLLTVWCARYFTVGVMPNSHRPARRNSRFCRVADGGVNWACSTRHIGVATGSRDASRRRHHSGWRQHKMSYSDQTLCMCVGVRVRKTENWTNTTDENTDFNKTKRYETNQRTISHCICEQTARQRKITVAKYVI